MCEYSITVSANRKNYAFDGVTEFLFSEKLIAFFLILGRCHCFQQNDNEAHKVSCGKKVGTRFIFYTAMKVKKTLRNNGAPSIAFYSVYL